MADGLGHALVIGGPDDVDARQPGIRRPIDHDGELLAKGADPAGLVFRPEQDQRLAAEVEQDLGRPPLVPGRRSRAEHQVVTELGGGRVDVGGQLGVEGITHVHDHAEMMAALAGQQAGRPVRAVAQFAGGLEDPAAGRFARARLVPQHQRHQPGETPARAATSASRGRRGATGGGGARLPPGSASPAGSAARPGSAARLMSCSPFASSGMTLDAVLGLG